MHPGVVALMPGRQGIFTFVANGLVGPGHRADLDDTRNAKHGQWWAACSNHLMCTRPLPSSPSGQRGHGVSLDVRLIARDYAVGRQSSPQMALVVPDVTNTS